MIDAAYIQDHYVGIPLEGYKEFLFGLEKITDIWFELVALGEEEWKSVGDEERFGQFVPDFAVCAAHERNANIGVVTIRHIESARLAGYYVFTVGHPLKTAGKLVCNETGLYIVPEHRDGWMFRYFIRYVEKVAKHFGCKAVVVSHRPDAPRIGKLYERCGYKAANIDYFKPLDD